MNHLESLGLLITAVIEVYKCLYFINYGIMFLLPILIISDEEED